MGTRVLLAALLGGVVLFLWSAASWMVMPWSEMAVREFGDAAAVEQAVLAGAPTSGVYFLPFVEEPAPEQPMIFAAVRHEGARSMGVAMAGQFVLNVLAMLIAALLLINVRPLSFAGRTGFVAAIGFTAWLVISASHFLWWGFSPAFTLAELVNTVVGWTLAGLVLAWLLAPRGPATVPPAEADRVYEAA